MVYNHQYLEDRYVKIDNNVCKLSKRRTEVLNAFVSDGRRLLDFGCGTGSFVRSTGDSGRWESFGTDLVQWDDRIPFIRDWKKTNPFDVVTFFDSLEHLPDPKEPIHHLNPRFIMISVPECHYPNEESWFMNWKHRRPGEHLYHWNRNSLDRFFGDLGYQPIMHSSFEDDFRPRYDSDLTNILTAIYRKI